MLINEKKVRTVTLDDADLKQAIIMYLKERGERNINESNIDIDPKKVKAIITIIEEIEPTNK